MGLGELREEDIFLKAYNFEIRLCLAGTLNSDDEAQAGFGCYL